MRPPNEASSLLEGLQLFAHHIEAHALAQLLPLEQLRRCAVQPSGGLCKAIASSLCPSDRDGCPADRDLRSAVTLLTQEGFLFAGSVEDNIRVGKPSATRTEVEAAARAMGADAFIRALPDGQDTDIRKRGARLSAGQRQMLAFARAFLADPAVLILDEATSALDIPTERAMQAALGKLLSGRTALIIAHRLSTVEIADRVLVIADGRVVDDGTPAALLAKGTGEFAALYRDAQGLSVHAGGAR